MASITLLDVVQRYLNSTDGFFVSSIGETEEAEQVALIAQEVYERLVQDLPYRQFKRKWGQLDNLSDEDHPNYLLIRNEIQRISESKIWYNIADTDEGEVVSWKEITYYEPEEFLHRIALQSEVNESSQVVQDFGGAKYVIQNDQDPTFCTSFDGKYLIFDSFNKEKGDTLHALNTQMVYFAPEPFYTSDEFVIPLPEDMIQGYIDMVKAEASETLRQEALPSAARRARQFIITERQRGNRIGNSQARNKKYGRNGRGLYKTKTGRQ